MSRKKTKKMNPIKGVLTMVGIIFTVAVVVKSCSTPANAGKIIWNKDNKPVIKGDENKTIKGCVKHNPLLKDNKKVKCDGK